MPRQSAVAKGYGGTSGAAKYLAFFENREHSVEKIILKENQIAYEIKTSGVQALIEGVTNEYQ